MKGRGKHSKSISSKKPPARTKAVTRKRVLPSRAKPTGKAPASRVKPVGSVRFEEGPTLVQKNLVRRVRVNQAANELRVPESNAVDDNKVLTPLQKRNQLWRIFMGLVAEYNAATLPEERTEALNKLLAVAKADNSMDRLLRDDMTRMVDVNGQAAMNTPAAMWAVMEANLHRAAAESGHTLWKGGADGL